MHPFLQDQENLRAFQQLTAAPTGSVRKWEQLLNWKPGRLQRFLATLVRYELAEITSCKHHSVFRPLTDQPLHTATHRYTPLHPNQATASGLTTKPRFGGSPVEEQDGAIELIAVMNKVLCRNHPMDFLPVQADNRGSHAAAKSWLLELRIPLGDAIEILRRKCEAFNPSKVNGEMPRSLGFFTKSVTAEWRRVQRDRQQLKLFPKLEMHIERGDDVPAPTPQLLAQIRAELEQKAQGEK